MAVRWPWGELVLGQGTSLARHLALRWSSPPAPVHSTLPGTHPLLSAPVLVCSDLLRQDIFGDSSSMFQLQLREHNLQSLVEREKVYCLSQKEAKLHSQKYPPRSLIGLS